MRLGKVFFQFYGQAEHFSEVAKMSVAIVGAGKIGQAMARGFVRAGLVSADRIISSSPNPECLTEMGRLGVRTTYDNMDAVKPSNVVFLAVKPNMMPTVLDEIAPVINERHLVVTLAAGITIDFVEQKLPPNARVIRVMTNTPCIVGEGATIFARGAATKHTDSIIVRKFFSSIGFCDEGDESFIDAVTGLGGSGPAYAFCAMDALADGGVKMGLPRQLALKLAAQTLLGAAKMVLETDRHPMDLKDDVCSPGGSTICAIHRLEEDGFRKCLINAVEVATLKSKELSQQNGEKTDIKGTNCEKDDTRYASFVH
ncbi:pyrroline-5-carboxylate reductase 1, mitochondrial-like [Saccoglossus kowalevskii]|uniref:Pyrroline-5-carboxylate reductase n=1 Tax=Saccoglossus kowalevskii TaxID=10224 RepID=A0ABM0GSG7_SACKO|nr:PREDICTED: pyrroline-5-carboxylate reductase 2-like [Saccoglossus kowalevskii]